MIFDDIISKIREEYSSGLTQSQLSEKYKISQNHICYLLSGRRKVENIELSTFLKMFPKATINLDGEPKVHGIINQGHNAGTMNGVINHAPATQEVLNEKMKRILADEKLTAEEKNKFISILLEK